MAYNFWFFYIGGTVVLFLSLNGKSKKWVEYVGCIAIFAVMSSAIPSTVMWSDLNNYEYNFVIAHDYVALEPANDWAYYNLMHFLKTCGLSFMEAKAVLMLICLMLLLRFLHSYPLKANIFVLLFFLLFMTFQTSIILRNSIGFMVALQGFKCLLEGKNHGSAKCILWIVLASQFHSMLYLMLPLACVNVKNIIKKYRKLFLAVLVVFVVALIVMIRNNILISMLAGLIGESIGSEKYMSYAVAKSRYAWMAVILIWMLLDIISIFFSIENRKCRKLQEVPCEGYKLEQLRVKKVCYQQNFMNAETILLRILIVSSIYAPLCVFTLHFYRYLKYLSLLFVLYMALIYCSSSDKKMKRKTFFFTLLVMGLWLFFEMFIYGGYSPDILNDYMIQGTWFWR